jgi:hypothetical protein
VALAARAAAAALVAKAPIGPREVHILHRARVCGLPRGGTSGRSRAGRGFRLALSAAMVGVAWRQVRACDGVGVAWRHERGGRWRARGPRALRRRVTLAVLKHPRAARARAVCSRAGRRFTASMKARGTARGKGPLRLARPR